MEQVEAKLASIAGIDLKDPARKDSKVTLQ